MTQDIDCLRAWRGITRCLVNWRRQVAAASTPTQLPITALCGYMQALSIVLSRYEDTSSDQVFYAELQSTLRWMDRAGEWFWLSALLRLDEQPVAFVEHTVSQAALCQFTEMGTAVQDSARTVRHINRWLPSTMMDHIALALVDKHNWETRVAHGQSRNVHYVVYG